MKKPWALMVLAAIVFGVSLPPSNAAQKHRPSTAVSRETVAPQLSDIGKFKAAFQADAGKVRLVALISPT